MQEGYWTIKILISNWPRRQKFSQLLQAGKTVASHAGVFRGARISSLPTNACSTENNIPFSLFYLRGKWPINNCAIKCWQAKHDWTWPWSYHFPSFLSFAKVMQCTEYSEFWLKLIFAALNLTFIAGQKAFPVFNADWVIIRLPCGQGQLSRIWKVQCDWLSLGKECYLQLSRRLWGGKKNELP